MFAGGGQTRHKRRKVDSETRHVTASQTGFKLLKPFGCRVVKAGRLLEKGFLKKGEPQNHPTLVIGNGFWALGFFNFEQFYFHILQFLCDLISINSTEIQRLLSPSLPLPPSLSLFLWSVTIDSSCELLKHLGSMKRCANIYIGTAESFKQPQWFRSKPTEIYEIYGDGSKPTPSFEGHVHPQTIFMGQYYTIFPKRYSPNLPPPRDVTCRLRAPKRWAPLRRCRLRSPAIGYTQNWIAR